MGLDAKSELWREKFVNSAGNHKYKLYNKTDSKVLITGRKQEDVQLTVHLRKV